MGFELVHDSLADLGLAICWTGRPLPAFALVPDLVDQFCGDWIALQSDPVSAARLAAKFLAEENRFDLIVDLLVANRGLLAEELRRFLWQLVGQGLWARRTIRDRTADALSRLPRSLVTEATRCGVLIHVARENRDLAIECFRLLRSDRFTASTYQAQQRKTLRKKTQKDKRANMKSKDSPLALMQRLRSAENSRDRGSAANALGLLGVGDKEAIAALVETLKSDADLIVRSSAANALGLLARRGSHKFVGLFRA